MPFHLVPGDAVLYTTPINSFLQDMFNVKDIMDTHITVENGIMKVEIIGLYDVGEEYRKAHSHPIPGTKAILWDGWDGPNPVVYVEGEELRSQSNFMKRATEINERKKAEDEFLDKLASKIVARANKKEEEPAATPPIVIDDAFVDALITAINNRTEKLGYFPFSICGTDRKDGDPA